MKESLPVKGEFSDVASFITILDNCCAARLRILSNLQDVKNIRCRCGHASRSEFRHRLVRPHTCNVGRASQNFRSNSAPDSSRTKAVDSSRALSAATQADLYNWWAESQRRHTFSAPASMLCDFANSVDAMPFCQIVLPLLSNIVLGGNMLKSLVITFAVTLLATAASAKCPAKSPSIEGRVTFDAADKRVNAKWLEKNLSGRRVRFDDGTEHYKVDGSYSYKAGSNTWDAPEYRFYNNGLRCIGYSSLRYDIYVVNGGKLVLINGSGNRFVGRILK